MFINTKKAMIEISCGKAKCIAKTKGLVLSISGSSVWTPYCKGAELVIHNLDRGDSPFTKGEIERAFGNNALFDSSVNNRF